ncbi:Uma2 family endonuclease [Actinomadura sp. LD22]|uniref:Uma2 family endonuclease n=1 Tax=Actinomadura physcomitrii TaxID=2650748 RepID=A0A6I4MGQ8_9ACTN|nr:Uma2 family endonuclease [Actinomadura physcomitrii]MWA03344.1 Uma2 family endonuclease [Actinomadura physcomitrii]
MHRSVAPFDGSRTVSVAHDRDGFGPYTAEDLHAREDEGRGLELEDGWLIELSPSAPHNLAYRRIHEFVEAAVAEAGAAVYADRGGDWEIGTPAGIRRPDVFAVPSEVVRAAMAARSPAPLPGHEVLLVVEVVSPGSGSERTDRVRKIEDYAAAGIPQYWITDLLPRPRVQVFVLDGRTGTYRLDLTAEAGEVLEVKVDADRPFTVRFDPQQLAGF